MRIEMVVTVTAVKRKRLVDENGIHYPIQKICVSEHVQTTRRHSLYYILKLSPEYGMKLAGSGIRKGKDILIEGKIEGVCSGNDTYLEMNDPSITMIKPRKRKKNLRIVGFTPDKFMTI